MWPTRTPPRPLSARRVVPLLPLRDLVVFPHMLVPLIVGRERSILTLAEAQNGGRELFLAAQKDARNQNPGAEDIHERGTFAHLTQMLRLPDGTVKVLVEGKKRGRIVRAMLDGEGPLRVEAEELNDLPALGSDVQALARAVKNDFDTWVKLTKVLAPEGLASIGAIEEIGRLSDVLAGHLNLKMEERQALLEELDPEQRLEKVHEHIQSEIEILQVERKIKSRVKQQMERSQREYYLHEQMAAIQKELGDKDDFRSELRDLEEKIEQTPLSEEAAVKLRREVRKLRMMSPMSAEATVVRGYVETVLSLPWGRVSEARIDLARAAEVLDEDHYGLRKIKERVLEYLAVCALVDRLKGPILCLVGPPGVGKTSLARSVARATQRGFVRVALGGVRDEAEIRGHRRTYIGAMPGKIVQALRKAGTNNPVFLLDEIDKMSTDFRGDPSAALLEVLDPEQNESFNDHYLDLDYDLSKVMFICTANSLQGIPPPLQDRLEIIRLAGYTEQEKVSIARRYLIPRQMENHGLREGQLVITQQAVLDIIHKYTREAGVRNLDREIATICRKVARHVVQSGPDTRVKVSSTHLDKLLGVPRFRAGRLAEADEVGFVNGLAWTAVGGVMVPIEAVAVQGSGKTTLTGQLGSVFQESCQAAITYARRRAEPLGLSPTFYQSTDLHVHVPELWGVDGPSAGITIATAVVSAATGRPVHRDLAMTGEITLRGRVRPIGGLKEKLLAAQRAGVKKVIIPKDNEPDLAEVPAGVKESLHIVPVESMDEVLAIALISPEPAFSSRE